MPFDCAPIIDAPKSLPALDGDVLDFGTKSPNVIIARPIPAWHAIRRPECVGDTLAVLALARALLADERRWCRGSFARGWREIPVPVRSVFARRYCALGAIMRAGRKLGLRFEDAANALEWQPRRPVPGWNDEPCGTHAGVIDPFDGAIAAEGHALNARVLAHGSRPTAAPSPCCSDVNDLQSFDLWNAGAAGCWMFEASSASRRSEDTDQWSKRR